MSLNNQGKQIELAVKQLLAGGLVAMPTETVYGLGADAENVMALNKIFLTKDRPSNHPLIVHISDATDLNYWTSDINDYARKLIKAFWPGPLTLIMKKADHINSVVTGGQNTIGIRCPEHPVALELLRQFALKKPNGCAGIAAPSANKFGHVSPTTAQHVHSEFAGQNNGDIFVLDGGSAQVGIESTIIDVSSSNVPVLLRPGRITAEQIKNVIGVYPDIPSALSPQVSGSLKAHYAPNTKLLLLDKEKISKYIENFLSEQDEKIGLALFETNYIETNLNIDIWQVSCDHAQYARNMYAMLRDMDNRNYKLIIIQKPPQTKDWQAINDRLTRAAAAFDS